MPKLSPRAFGLALGTVIGSLSLLCALAYRTFPQGTARFFSFIFHGLDPQAITRPLPAGDVFVGLLITTVGGFIIGAALAACYNHCLPRSSAGRTE